MSVTPAPCTGIDATELERHVLRELPPQVELVERREGFVTTVDVECEPAGLRLSLRDPVTRKTMTRVLDVTAIPPHARARLIALALVEFVQASWIELTVDPPAPVPPAGPAPSEALIRQARRSANATIPGSRRLTVSVAAIARGFPGHDLWVAGGTFQLHHRPIPHLLWGFDADVSGWRRREALGRAEVVLPTIGAGLGGFGSVGRVEIWSAVWARAGLAAVAGRPDDPATIGGRRFVEPWGGLAAQLGVRIDVHDRVAVQVHGETGLILRGVRALDPAGAVLFSLEGAWVTASAGVAVRL